MLNIQRDRSALLEALVVLSLQWSYRFCYLKKKITFFLTSVTKRQEKNKSDAVKYESACVQRVNLHAFPSVGEVRYK